MEREDGRGDTGDILEEEGSWHGGETSRTTKTFRKLEFRDLEPAYHGRSIPLNALRGSPALENGPPVYRGLADRTVYRGISSSSSSSSSVEAPPQYRGLAMDVAAEDTYDVFESGRSVRRHVKAPRAAEPVVPIVTRPKLFDSSKDAPPPPFCANVKDPNRAPQLPCDFYELKKFTHFKTQKKAREAAELVAQCIRSNGGRCKFEDSFSLFGEFEDQDTFDLVEFNVRLWSTDATTTAAEFMRHRGSCVSWMKFYADVKETFERDGRFPSNDPTETNDDATKKSVPSEAAVTAMIALARTHDDDLNVQGAQLLVRRSKNVRWARGFWRLSALRSILGLLNSKDVDVQRLAAAACACMCAVTCEERTPTGVSDMVRAFCDIAGRAENDTQFQTKIHAIDALLALRRVSGETAMPSVDRALKALAIGCGGGIGDDRQSAFDALFGSR